MKLLLVIIFSLMPSIVTAAGSFSVSNGNTTIKFEYVKTTSVMSNTINKAAQFLYEHGYGDKSIPFSTLTNQQKINVIDSFIKNSIVNYAKSQSMQAVINNVTESNKAAELSAIEAETANSLTAIGVQ